MRRSVFALLIGLVAGSAAGAEDLVFVSGAVGAGTHGVAGLASVNVVRCQRLFEFRVANTSEFEIFGPSPSNSVSDFGVLVGRAPHSGRRLELMAVGLGVVHSVKRGTRLLEQPMWFFGGRYNSIEHRTLGIPLELRAGAHAGPVGLGLIAFGNVNLKDSFAAVALVVDLGKLR